MSPKKQASAEDLHSEESAKKRAKLDPNGTKSKKQSSIHSFFTASPSSSRGNKGPATKTKKREGGDKVKSEGSSTNTVMANQKESAKRSSSKDPTTAPKPEAELETATTQATDLGPVIPTTVSDPRNVRWISLHDQHVIVRRVAGQEPRPNVAALDLDGTLVEWTISGWPNQLQHYELWNSNAIEKLRALYDGGDHALVIVSNQGGVQKAHTGKKASLVKSVINWLAARIDRPLFAVLSTRTPKKCPETSFHKPSHRMWKVASDQFNGGRVFDVARSLFVGDSTDDPSDPQGGVDAGFAKSVTRRYGGGDGAALEFYTPVEFFGPSNAARRQAAAGMGGSVPPPDGALRARAALLGGYLTGPVLLILCGVQGSGKSTFCERLLRRAGGGKWVHLSQDTINNGKPGKREKVEEQALAGLKTGACVVVDRTHLTADQRGHFVQVAKLASVPVHCVFLLADKDVVTRRIRNRTNHPGKLEGEAGVKLAMRAMQGMVLPTYDKEGDLELITCCRTTAGADRLADLYGGIGVAASQQQALPRDVTLTDELAMPVIALGTMKVGKRVTDEVIASATAAGFRAFDTALTYQNEGRLGADAAAVPEGYMFCISKIPKRAASPAKVRSELDALLENLHRDAVDLLLLHWPCDVIASGTLGAVWAEMEACRLEGKCRALGVCNFNVGALSALLAVVDRFRPVLNQVERHPLLPQWELLDFCETNGILLQAHTPLAQGRADLLEHPVLAEIAKDTSQSTAQVALQWNLQQGVAVVPKCATREHQLEAQTCKPLSARQMKALDNLALRSSSPKKRFVAPPFMYGKAAYCWGDQMPITRSANN